MRVENRNGDAKGEPATTTTMTRKGKVVISVAAATRRYNLDHETDRILAGHDLVCFGTVSELWILWTGEEEREGN